MKHTASAFPAKAASSAPESFGAGRKSIKKLSAADLLSKALYTVLAACFIWIVIKAFAGSSYSYKPLFLGAATAAALALIVLFWLLVRRFESFFAKHSKLVTLGFLLFMGVCQIVFSFMLRYDPVFDIGAIYGGASQWAYEGAFADYYEYFGMFHNNYGGLVLLRLLFGFTKLVGIKDTFIAACALNMLLSIATMYLTGSVCQKLIGVRARIMAYFLFLISLPFFFIAPAFYTDALSMVFPVLILRLCIVSSERKRLTEKIACFILIGVAAGIGYGIKATVLVMLFAVIIDCILRRSFKEWLSMAACTAVMVFAIAAVTQGVVYAHIGRDYAEQKRIPVTHWIMMGMAHSGGYNVQDYDYTLSFEDPAERKEAVRRELAERVKALDVKSAFELFNKKIDLDFNDGTYGLADTLACPHGRDNFLHSFLLNDSERNVAYRHICTGVLTALYLLLILSCVFDVFGRGDTVGLLAPRLAMFGLFLFFLMWEARWRYFSSYAPVIMICAVIGLESAFSAINRRGKLKRRKTAA